MAINGFNTKTHRYVTKADVMEVLRACNKAGADAEGREFAIKNMKAVKISGSRKLGKSFERKTPQGYVEEFCPHCGKSIDVYNCSRKIPKYCYCVFCGGAIQRPHGDKNPLFDMSIVEESNGGH